MHRVRTIGLCCAALFVCAAGARAVSISTVLVDNAGNDGELSGGAVCGAVGYNYRIARYEVTAGQYTDFLNAVAGIDTYGLYNSHMWVGSYYPCGIERYEGTGVPGDLYSYRVAEEWADRPVSYVSWGDAARFANWLHNGQPGLGGRVPQDEDSTEDGAYTLNGAITDAALFAVDRNPGWRWAIPSEDEWYKAAYHQNDGVTGNYFNYATSTSTAPSNDLVEPNDPGNNATFLIGSSDYTIGSPYYRTEAGAHEDSESPYGTFDQSGNLMEWTERIMYDGNPAMGLRGGSFYDWVGQLHADHRASGIPTSEGFALGFRVVAPDAVIPEPAGLGLIGIGLMAIRKRRR